MNTYAGAAIHGDNLHTVAASKNKQARMITNFTRNNYLSLNLSKLEFLRVSKQFKEPELLDIAGVDIETSSTAKCLGIWWQYNLSASCSVQNNINKARKAFFYTR